MKKEKTSAPESRLIEERRKNKAQSHFLARTSHSMRTPVTAILGISEVMLRDSALPAHVEEAFAKIHSSGKLLLGLANDFLDLPKISSGELPVTNEPYDISALILDITALHKVHLGSRNIVYKVHIDPQMPAVLIGDELRIKQILDNLLSNAFKFTENGTIELKARWMPGKTENIGKLIFEINDTGLGMEPGTGKPGLGLPISRSALKSLRAKINITSEPGMGTGITVTIPQGTQPGGLSQKKIIPEKMPYARALVVDDVESCLFVVKALLGFYDIHTDLASGGEAAIKKVQANAYDIIFMDHIMPGIDGIEATRIIREMGYTVPIVAITANAIFGQETEYLKRGFDAYLPKPIDPEEFDGVLRRLVRDRQPQCVLDEVAALGENAPRAASEDTPDETHAQVTAKLRQDFARKQRDVYTEIAIALGNSKPETARWHVDSIKNMAGMIGEPVLSRIAADVSNAIAAGEIPTRLLEMLNQELTTVLAGIPEESAKAQAALSDSEARALFAELYHLLDTDCAECMFLTEKLKLIPNTEELIKHIENFDFPEALKALAELRKNRR